MLISLQLSQFTKPICNRSFLLDECSTHLVVGSIGVNVEWFIVVRVCHKDICSPESFHDFKCIMSFSGVQQKVFLSDFSDNVYSKCACLGHMSQYVLAASWKLHISFMLYDCSCSRKADMHFFQGLRPVGSNQYLSKLVSCKAQSHLRGFNNEVICFEVRKWFVKENICSSMCWQMHQCHQGILQHYQAHVWPYP